MLRVVFPELQCPVLTAVLVVVVVPLVPLVVLETRQLNPPLKVIMVELLALTVALVVVAQGPLVVLVVERPPEMAALVLHHLLQELLLPTLVVAVAVEVNLLALVALQQVVAAQAGLFLITMV